MQQKQRMHFFLSITGKGLSFIAFAGQCFAHVPHLTHFFTSQTIGFSLKKDFIKKVDEQVDKDPSYTSRTDFIRCAVREKIKRLQEESKT